MVNPELFSKRSSIFNQYYKPNSENELSIDGDYPPSSFQAFVDVIHDKTSSITEENKEDIRSLANLWRSEYVINILDSNLSEENINPSLLLQQCIERYDKKQSIQEFIPKLVSNFSEIIKCPNIIRFPGNVIPQILHRIDLNTIDCHDLFRFINGYVFVYHKYAGLFNFIDFSKLTDDELKEFFQLAYSNQNLTINPNLISGALSILSNIIYQRYKRITTINKELDQQANKLMEDVDKIKANSHNSNISQNKKKHKESSMHFKISSLPANVSKKPYQTKKTTFDDKTNNKPSQSAEIKKSKESNTTEKPTSISIKIEKPKHLTTISGSNPNLENYFLSNDKTIMVQKPKANKIQITRNII